MFHLPIMRHNVREDHFLQEIKALLLDCGLSVNHKGQDSTEPHPAWKEKVLAWSQSLQCEVTPRNEVLLCLSDSHLCIWGSKGYPSSRLVSPVMACLRTDSAGSRHLSAITLKFCAQKAEWITKWCKISDSMDSAFEYHMYPLLQSRRLQSNKRLQSLNGSFTHIDLLISSTTPQHGNKPMPIRQSCNSQQDSSFRDPSLHMGNLMDSPMIETHMCQLLRDWEWQIEELQILG